MKKIILLVLALMVLIGAGVGGYLLFGPKPEGEEKAEEAPPPKPTGPPLFVPIGPMIVPVIGEKPVAQNILLVVSLEVYGDATREMVRQQSPRLVDAFLTALYGGIESGMVMDGQIINVGMVKDKLMKAAEKVLGPDVVHDVLIQAVSQRPAQ